MVCPTMDPEAAKRLKKNAPNDNKKNYPDSLLLVSRFGLLMVLARMMEKTIPLVALLAFQSFGCDLYTRPKKDLLSEGTVVAVVRTQVNRKLDLLYVVDNSNSMQEEQDSLAAGFPAFAAELSMMEGGFPNVHIAVVSTDVGAGPYAIVGCEGRGDNGALRSMQCNGRGNPYVSDVSDEFGTRTVNYEGTLQDVFSCMVDLGVSGCGFEQPLESMRRALNDSQAGNAGFLREDAHLAVIFLTDEDDCSAESTELFDSAPFRDQIDSDLGPLSSFRCFEFGVTCEGADPRAPGAREGCVARTDSPYLRNLKPYKDFLRSLKARPSDVYVAGITGGTTTVSVSLNDGEPKLAPSCCPDGFAQCDADAIERANPAVRLGSFLSSFGRQSTQDNICNPDLSSASAKIARALRLNMEGSPCLHGVISSLDSCIVEEVRGFETSLQARQVIPRCDNELVSGNSSVLPCYAIERSDASCPDSDTNLMVSVEYGSGIPGVGTDIVVTCDVD